MQEVIWESPSLASVPKQALERETKAVKRVTDPETALAGWGRS